MQRRVVVERRRAGHQHIGFGGDGTVEESAAVGFERLQHRAAAVGDPGGDDEGTSRGEGRRIGMFGREQPQRDLACTQQQAAPERLGVRPRVRVRHLERVGEGRAAALRRPQRLYRAVRGRDETGSTVDHAAHAERLVVGHDRAAAAQAPLADRGQRAVDTARARGGGHEQAGSSRVEAGGDLQQEAGGRQPAARRDHAEEFGPGDGRILDRRREVGERAPVLVDGPPPTLCEGGEARGIGRPGDREQALTAEAGGQQIVGAAVVSDARGRGLEVGGRGARDCRRRRRSGERHRRDHRRGDGRLRRRVIRAMHRSGAVRA